MNASNKQSGFSAVLSIAAIVLVVSILGFIGWRLYNQSHPTNASATTNNTSSSQPSNATTSGSTTTTQPTILDIKELGVKLTLDDSIKDVVYAPIQPQPTDGSKIFGLSTQSLINSETDGKGYCAAANAPLGMIRESSTQPTSLAGPVPVDNKTLFKIGNNYYQYTPNQGVNYCGLTTSGTPNSIFTSKRNAFANDFTTIQPDN